MSEFHVRLRRRDISEDDLLEDLKRCAAELSKDTITAAEYTTKGSFGVNTFLRRFKQWNLALRTYEQRFGSWNKALLAFESFIKSGKVSEVESAAPRPFRTNKRTGSKVNWRLRAQVLIRDNCICQMCGASPAKDPNVILHADHIKPWSKGGETVLGNLRTLCLKCNIGKSDLHDEAS